MSLYRMSVNYCYNFKNSPQSYFLRYLQLVCFIVKGNASSFLFFLPCVCEVLARGTVALDDRKDLRCALPLVLRYVLLVKKCID